MNPTVITYEGERDGLRFGDMRFPGGEQRHFLLDRISGRIRLWNGVRDLNHLARDEEDDREDRDPDRLAAALAAVRGRP